MKTKKEGKIIKKEGKTNWFQSRTKRNKKLLLASISVIGIIITSSIVGIMSYNASLYDDDFKGWGVEEGDVYYLGLKDDYYYTDRDNNDDFIRKFRVCLKSEIMAIEDVALDLDLDDDLTVMSSFLFGQEGFFSVEVANTFDLYQLLLPFFSMQSQDLDSIMAGELNLNETFVIPFSIPSAIHYVCSDVPKYIDAMYHLYNFGNISETTLPDWDFELADIYGLIEWLFFQSTIFDKDHSFYEDFDDFDWDQYPMAIESYGDSGFDLIASDPNNFADSNIRVDPHESFPPEDFVMRLYQHYNTSETKVYLDLFNYFNTSTPLGERINLEEYMYQIDQFSFDLEIDGDNMFHDFEVLLNTNDFDITGEVKGMSKQFSGFNGFNFKIHNGDLYYNVGDYLYSSELNDFRETFPSEKGWKNTGFNFLFDGQFYNNSPYGEQASIKISPHYSDYTYTIRIENPSHQVWSYTVPMYYDCPYEFLYRSCYDNIKERNIIFRMNNMTNLYFIVDNSTFSDSKDLIDDISIDGEFYYETDNFVNLISDFFFWQTFLISAYHIMFYPTGFLLDEIESLANSLNEIVNKVFGLTKIFEINSDNNELRLTITFPLFQELLDIIALNNRHPPPPDDPTWIGTFLWMQVYLGDRIITEYYEDLITFLEGDLNIEYSLVFDKNVGILNESMVTVEYLDTGITREIGMQFLAGRRIYLNREIAIYKNYYPAYPDADWLQMEQIEALEGEIQAMALYYYLGMGVTIVGAVISIEAIVLYVKKRKLK